MLKKTTLLFFIFLFYFSYLIIPVNNLSQKFHPELKWEEISNQKFIVIFQKGYKNLAFYTLEKAQEIYSKSLKFWQNPIKGKIRILLTDIYDNSNGYATYFPFNQIGIYIFNPEPESMIGSYRDWIYLVLSHEMTHIFNLNSGSGFTYFLRNIFGNSPISYPASMLPTWILEGLAVYMESKLNQWGRLNTPDFNIILNNIAKEKKIPFWTKLYGNSTTWPGPTSKYLYGAEFFQFLADKYGEEKIPEFVKDYTHDPIQLSISNVFKKTFDKSLTCLWNEFCKNIATSENIKKNPIKSLTKDGLYKKYPIVINKEKILFVRNNYKKYPGIFELNPITGKTKRLIKKSIISGLSYSKVNNKLYFSSVDYIKSYYNFSDLYEYDLSTKRLKKLSKGKRLFYPIKIDKSNKFYCVKRIKSKSFIVLFDQLSKKERIISKGFNSISHISLSSDKNFIAASIKRNNSNWSIAIFSKEGKLIEILTDNKLKSYYPHWKNLNEIYFITEYEKKYRLAFMKLKQRKFYIYKDKKLPSIKYFFFAGKSDKIIVSFFNSNGFDIGLLNLLELKPEEVYFNKSSNNEKKVIFNKSYRIKKYNFIRDLAPKYFICDYRNAGNYFQPGIYMSGNDILFKNQFIFKAYYGLKTNRFSYNFTYCFDVLYPSLIFQYKNYSNLYNDDNNQEYLNIEEKLKMGCLFPISIREKSQYYLYSDIYFEKNTDKDFNNQENYNQNLNGIKFSFIFNSAKRYYDAISDSDGTHFTISYIRDDKILGSDFNINTASLELKQFISIFRPNVLALRLGISDSWGKAKRLFYMGGNEIEQNFTLDENNIFRLMRGFPSGYFRGTGGYILNLEYRISLMKIERAIWILPAFERIYLTFFTDIGNLWSGEKKIKPSFSFGTEINLITYFRKYNLIFSGGIAFGKRPDHNAIFYFRIGKSF